MIVDKWWCPSHGSQVTQLLEFVGTVMIRRCQLCRSALQAPPSPSQALLKWKREA